MRVTAVLVASLSLAGCTSVLPGVGPSGPQGPGEDYQAYLGGSADRLVVELDHAPGALWDTSTDARQDVVDQVERITQKEVVVETNASLPAKGEDYSYDIAELVELREAYRDLEGDADTVVLHALFVDGEFQGSVAGLAFAADTFALFKGHIDESSSTCDNDAAVCGDPVTAVGSDQAAVREWELTRAVAIHEAGHLFGLVDCPLPMVEDHEMDQDPRPETEGNEGKCHSDNQDSVMHWQVEGEGGAESFFEGGEVPWTFDADDVQDVRAVQDGAS
jgi:hypothetical protein